MKAAICACLFLLACKSESKPAAQPDETPTPTELAPKQARPRPTLPDGTGSAHTTDRARPQLPDQDDDGEPRDWADPAMREEMRAMREERRKQREAELDTNKDGVLSPEERAQRMAPMHKRLDSDGNGKVTPDELAASSSNRRMGFDDPAAVDTDKNGDISLAELETAVTARREQMRQRWRGRGGRGSANLGPGPE